MVNAITTPEITMEKNLKLIQALLAMSLIAFVACDKIQPEKDKLTEPKEAALDVNQAKIELEKKNIGNAVEIIIKVHKSDPSNSEAYYVESQADSLKGALDEAIASLEKALVLGYNNFEDIKINKNLEALRSKPQFITLMNKYDKTSAAVVSETEIQAGDVSIKEVGGKQVVKAGDVTINLE